MEIIFVHFFLYMLYVYLVFPLTWVTCYTTMSTVLGFRVYKYLIYESGSETTEKHHIAKSNSTAVNGRMNG